MCATDQLECIHTVHYAIQIKPLSGKTEGNFDAFKAETKKSDRQCLAKD